MVNEDPMKKSPYEGYMDDDYFEDDAEDMYEARMRGQTQAGVDPNSFLGMSNQQYAPTQQEEQPEMSDQEQYISRLQSIQEKYGPDSQQGMSRAETLRKNIPVSDSTDRIWETMGVMASFALMTVGGPVSAMALSGLRYFMDDKARENRFNQIDELVADGYSDRTVRQWIDTGDDRYLAEDSRARVAAEKEQYARGIDIRNFEYGKEKDTKEFGLNVRKQDEVERSARAGESIQRGTLALNQQKFAWDKDPTRHASTAEDGNGVKWLLNVYGDPIRPLDAGEIDPTTGEFKPSAKSANNPTGYDLSQIPVGNVVIDGAPMVVEIGKNGKKGIRNPQKHERDAFGIDEFITAESNMKRHRKEVQPYISGEKEIPGEIANVSALLPFRDKPLFQESIAKLRGGDGDELLDYIELMDGEGTIRGVEEAKQMGASGINTVQEFETFKKNFPKLKFHSPEALRRTMKAQQDYITDSNERYFNKQKNWVDITTDGNGNVVSKGTRLERPGFKPETTTTTTTTTQPKGTGEAQPVPKVGSIVDGFIFLGGDPNDPTKWRKAQ